MRIWNCSRTLLPVVHPGQPPGLVRSPHGPLERARVLLILHEAVVELVGLSPLVRGGSDPMRLRGARVGLVADRQKQLLRVRHLKNPIQFAVKGGALRSRSSRPPLSRAGQNLVRLEHLEMTRAIRATAAVPLGGSGAPRGECPPSPKPGLDLSGHRPFGPLSRNGCAEGCGDSGPGYLPPSVHPRHLAALAARGCLSGPASAQGGGRTKQTFPMKDGIRAGP